MRQTFSSECFPSFGGVVEGVSSVPQLIYNEMFAYIYSYLPSSNFVTRSIL